MYMNGQEAEQKRNEYLQLLDSNQVEQVYQNS